MATDNHLKAIDTVEQDMNISGLNRSDAGDISSILHKEMQDIKNELSDIKNIITKSTSGESIIPGATKSLEEKIVIIAKKIVEVYINKSVTKQEDIKQEDTGGGENITFNLPLPIIKKTIKKTRPPSARLPKIDMMSESKSQFHVDFSRSLDELKSSGSFIIYDLPTKTEGQVIQKPLNESAVMEKQPQQPEQFRERFGCMNTPQQFAMSVQPMPTSGQQQKAHIRPNTASLPTKKPWILFSDSNVKLLEVGNTNENKEPQEGSGSSRSNTPHRK